jgi:hypothetical protein
MDATGPAGAGRAEATMNRIVARFQDGRILKGFTNDFLPTKDHFHLVDQQPPTDGKPLEVRVFELKALFFVKTFEGQPEHQEVIDPAAVSVKPTAGRRIRVLFKDGEVVVGTTQGYDKSRPGFFVIPLDPGSNNERCFVIAAATREVTFV